MVMAILLSRVVGFLREMYIDWAFGATSVTDVYNAGFTIPDWLNYLVAGGTASITFVSIYTRFLAEKREDEARKTFSAIITIMTAVLDITLRRKRLLGRKSVPGNLIVHWTSTVKVSA